MFEVTGSGTTADRGTNAHQTLPSIAHPPPFAIRSYSFCLDVTGYHNLDSPRDCDAPPRLLRSCISQFPFCC